jgi:ubiquitin-conjugating enzyme E2 M
VADLSELSLGSTMRTTFPSPDDILNFTLTIDPDEGMYKGGSFTFTFAINQNFPHDPPKVKCTQKIYHPNIDLEGNVCLNILREDWKPVLNLNAVIVGMQVRAAMLSLHLCSTHWGMAQRGMRMWNCMC